MVQNKSKSERIFHRGGPKTENRPEHSSSPSTLVPIPIERGSGSGSTSDIEDDSEAIITESLADMSVDNMFLNLKILAQIQEHDKLMSHENIIQIDKNSVLQGLRRWYFD